MCRIAQHQHIQRRKYGRALNEKYGMLKEAVIMWLNLGENGSADSEEQGVTEQSARWQIMWAS